jgi:hypothetical protein
MSFGITAQAAKISQTTTNKVEVDRKYNSAGEVIELGSFSGLTETSEEVFADSITNEAVNGQLGTSVVSSHAFVESNTDYQRATKTTIAVLASATTTTTTT